MLPEEGRSEALSPTLLIITSSRYITVAVGVTVSPYLCMASMLCDQGVLCECMQVVPPLLQLCCVASTYKGVTQVL